MNWDATVSTSSKQDVTLAVMFVKFSPAMLPPPHTQPPPRRAPQQRWCPPYTAAVFSFRSVWDEKNYTAKLKKPQKEGGSGHFADTRCSQLVQRLGAAFGLACTPPTRSRSQNTSLHSRSRDIGRHVCATPGRAPRIHHAPL